MTSPQTLLHKIFRDSHGKIIIFQPPNIPIWTWFVCAVLAKIVPDTSVFHRIFETVGFGALFTWAWLEIFQGTNYIRRMLGFAVLCIAVYVHVR